MEDEKVDKKIKNKIQNTKKYKISILILITLLLLCIGIIIFLAISSSSNFLSILNNNDTELNINVAREWKKPYATGKGYALILTKEKNKRSISVVSADDKKIIPTNLETIGIESAGAAAGFGDTEPKTSPDRNYFVYIDQDGDATLAANGTYEKAKITNHGRVKYLGGWSKDSKNIVYSVTDGVPRWEDLRSRPDDIRKLPSDYPGGFYMFNIDTGETKYLFPLKNFLVFIDDERILTQKSSSSNEGNTGTLEIFNINTFEMDYTNTNNKFGFGVGQYDFDPRGTKWAFTYSDVNSKSIDDNTERQLIYSDYPEINGEILDKGSWAGIQFPKFSPDGKYIGYQKRGRVENNVVLASAVYDLTKNLVKLNEGEFVDWLNSNQFLIKRKSDKNEYNYYIANLEDSTLVDL